MRQDGIEAVYGVCDVRRHDEVTAVVDIDLLGTFNVSKAAYDLWLREHGGAVVNISAAIQYRGMALQAHVVSAKAGVDAFSRACAIE